MDSAMLASLILPTVKADPRTSVPVLIANIRNQIGYTPSYRKAWIAKQKALEKMHSGWDASYDEIWQWCQQCRGAFAYCKPLVQIDGTFMYDRYTHRLLLAVAQDGSGRILPIAFAITPGESADHWDFFFSRLRMHVCPQPDICVISDRGTRILAVIERQGSLWHRTHHRYCLRHITSNYYRQYPSKGYEISKNRFHEMLTVFHSVNEEGHDYLCNIPFEQWTQAYDGSLRYGHMTSNLAECINYVLKGTHHLPITSVVQETYFHLAVLFPKRAASYAGQMQGGHVWCAKVLQEINKAKVRANTMHIVCHDRDNLWFRVTEFDKSHQGITGGQYHVHLRNRTCDCGRFDALRYPCAHVIAACQNLRLDPMSYVDDVYKLEYMYNVWRHIFPPVPDERKWPSVSLAPFKLLPDRELWRKPKGRSCSTRIRNNMDIRETMCGWCRNPGHTSRSCPNRNS
ncbi:uncharacterized protein LOC108462218 [Gossypium arboreum]|uniref:uncharacterized protein LOC108462218 n=1 Tax=Gossypium arboreum TaxID=29729 RepID=UPI0022F194A6|nr:uncharacterized protein LOC108462218 [Gossypium arboreum]